MLRKVMKNIKNKKKNYINNNFRMFMKKHFYKCYFSKVLFTQITLLSSSPKEKLLWKVSFAQITFLKEEFSLFLLFKSVIRASYTFQLLARLSATFKSNIRPSYTFHSAYNSNRLWATRKIVWKNTSRCQIKILCSEKFRW